MEALVQRLVQNPHDQDAITTAHYAGQSDPRSYAMLLEQVGKATQDPAFAAHWLTEAANVWSTSLGDAHRAARALMIAIDRDPTQPTPAERLADLYREKGDMKALVALLDRRGKALTALAQQDPDIGAHAGAVYEELGRLWSEQPLNQPRKAIENYKKAVQFDPTNQYAIYGLRELYKAGGQWNEAIPLFELELRIVDDPERQLALLQDEGEVRKSAGDLAGATQTLRNARAIEGGADPGLKQQLATSVLERVQAQQPVNADETEEAAQLFVDLAEAYPGEHGFSYSLCALDLSAANDRAAQLAMYYGEQLGREAEAAPRAAAYLKASPQGALSSQARELVNKIMELGGDESLLEALAPPPDADPGERAAALLDQAKGLARKAKKREAAAKYREILTIQPANEESVNFLESFLKQTRKYAELKDLLLAAAASPDADLEQRSRWLREVAGLCESQLRDMDGAIASWKQLIDLDPHDDGPMDQLQRLLERAKRWDDLTVLLQQKADVTDDIEARLSIEKTVAKIHEQRRKDPVATGEAWARIAALVPDDDDAIGTAVRFFEKGQRGDLAAQVIADNLGSVSNDQSRGNLSEKLGSLREAAGEFPVAGEAYAEAAALLKDPALWEAAERCFVQAESWEQAASSVDERANLTRKPKEQAELYAIEADYLARAGDDPGATERLEQATDLDPENEEFAADLEQRYQLATRHDDLAAFLLRRAEKLKDKDLRITLRKRAAVIQRDTLRDIEGARDSLQLVLEDADDPEALRLLADDMEESADWAAAAEYVGRLARATDSDEERIKVSLREAKLIAEGLEDRATAIERYEAILKSLDDKNQEALRNIADLHEAEDSPEGTADALERLLETLTENDDKLAAARRLADLYEGPLAKPAEAVRSLEMVREIDDEDFDALQRLSELSEKLEDWPKVAEYLAGLIEVEGDEEEVSAMTRRLAEILHEKVDKGDEALAALMAVADEGDEPCRQEYVTLGDKLGWKGIVATKLVEWYVEAPTGDERNEALRGAFERFIEVGRDADAASVAKELVRTKGADSELADKLEEIAVKLKDLEALEIAHDLKVQELSGPPRAEEMVRQAEVMAEAEVDSEEAIQHGEQALTSVSPEDVEPLLARLAKLAKAPGHIIDLYERQVTRCKAPNDRLRALARAAQVAAEHDAMDRARQFFDIALAGGVQEETLSSLEQIARDADALSDSHILTTTLAQALAAGGQGSRDGGRTRSALLGRAAHIAYADLDDVDQAFTWLGDAIVTHVDDQRLDELEALSEKVGDAKRAEAVLNRALEEVFDGPLVRKLLARRAALRQDKLEELKGAADDLKRLHDLSPSDTAVMDQLAALYTELKDYRGMVQLYEDQILRGKDTATRAELARKVARIWEEQLEDAREAADAWRRVLRMKSGDAEAQEGLERAKANMLKKPPVSDTPPEAEATSEEGEAKAGADEAETPTAEKPEAEESEADQEEAKASADAAPEAAEEEEAKADAASDGKAKARSKAKQRSRPKAKRSAAPPPPPPPPPPPAETEAPAKGLEVGSDFAELAGAGEATPVGALPVPPEARRDAEESTEEPDESKPGAAEMKSKPTLDEAKLPPPPPPSSPGSRPPPLPPGSSPRASAPPPPARASAPPAPSSPSGSKLPPPPPSAAGRLPPPPSASGRPPPPPPPTGASRRPPPPPPSGRPSRRPPPPPPRGGPSRRPPPPPNAAQAADDSEDIVVSDDELLE